MNIKWEEFDKNTGWRSLMLNWAINASKPKPTSRVEEASLDLDPTLAARLGLDYNSILRKKGLPLHTPSLQLEFNRQNSDVKSKEYEAALSIVMTEIFFRELMMVNQIQFQKLRDAFDDFFREKKKADPGSPADAVRLRFEEEVLAVDAKNAANLAKIDTTESSFVARLKEYMEEKEEWLGQAEKENNGWLDRVMSPIDSAENRAFRERFQKSVARENVMRRQNAQNLSRLRLQTEDAIKTASPEKKERLTKLLDDVVELEAEQKARVIRAMPKNLEEKAFVHLDQMSDYRKNVEFHTRKANRSAMSAEEGEKFEKEFDAWFSDVDRQGGVNNQIERAKNINLLHEQFEDRKINIRRKELQTRLSNPHKSAELLRPISSAPSNRPGVWGERTKAMQAHDVQQEKSKLIYRVQTALNVAEERTRKEDKVDSPKVSEYLNSVYHLIDDEERLRDEVLDKVKEQLDTMQKDMDLPDRMRDVAKDYSAQISGLTKLTEAEKKTEPEQHLHTNGKREAIKELDFESKKPSKALDVDNTRYASTKEKLEDLRSVSKLFPKLEKDKSITLENKTNLDGLKAAILDYCDNQTTSNAAALKEKHLCIDWDSLETNENAMDLKSLIETDDFLDQIPSAEKQDLDAANRPSKSF